VEARRLSNVLQREGYQMKWSLFVGDDENN
jgi:phosphoserine phosphatase